jgi:glycosyltransferase XagB
MGALAILLLVVLTSVMLDAWRTPDDADRTSFARDHEPHLSFSLLVPARHEEAVLADTLNRLASLDHPFFEVLAIVGHDDPDTAAVARGVAREHRHKVRVVVDHNWPKNKPKALNTALPECRGDIVGVFDAEDEVAMGLLRRVDACFRDPEVSVVQAAPPCPPGGHPPRRQHRLLPARRTRERRRLGRQLPRRGLRGRHPPQCHGPPAWRWPTSRTWSPAKRLPTGSAPCSNSGPAGTRVSSRCWPRASGATCHRGQRVRTWYMLLTPMLQAGSAVLIPISLFAAFKIHAPDAIALFLFAPLAVICVTLTVEAAGLHEFGRMYGQRVRVRDYVKLVLGIFPYQWLLAVAAVRAAVRHLRRDTSWEKTAHVGAHRRGDLALVTDRPVRVGHAIDTDDDADDEVEEEVAS